MPIKFKRHIPNFIDTGTPASVGFKNIDEILLSDWVKDWSERTFKGVPFWRFSKGKSGKSWLLIAEWKNDEDHTWWVVGYLDQDCDLPEFVATKKEN